MIIIKLAVIMASTMLFCVSIALSGVGQLVHWLLDWPYRWFLYLSGEGE